MQKSRNKKRKQVFNPETAETDESSFSTSARKLKMQEEIFIPRDSSVENRILNFIMVLARHYIRPECRRAHEREE